MAEHTHIEWTDATWNPITGCSVVSPGCTNCYAMRLAGARLKDHPSRAGLTAPSKAGPVWTGEVRLNEGWLTQPLAWKRPRRIFVCAHGDLFHEAAPDAWIDKVFAVMALAPHHTFQVLTKRAARMRAYLRAEDTGRRIALAMQAVREAAGYPRMPSAEAMRLAGMAVVLPLPNVWLGVSAEDDERLRRVWDLIHTPAAVRFLSAEPLLGRMDLTDIDLNGDATFDGLNPRPWVEEIEQWRGTSDTWEEDFLDWFELAEMPTGGNIHPTLDWVIAGGESGPGARPMHPDWARSLRDQCAAAGVPFFFKQWGEWASDGQAGWPTLQRPPILGTGGSREPDTAWPDGTIAHGWEDEHGGPGLSLSRVGKRAAGRLLDGVIHDGMPEAR